MLPRKRTNVPRELHPVEVGCTIEVDRLEVGADAKGQRVVELADFQVKSVVVTMCAMFRHE